MTSLVRSELRIPPKIAPKPGRVRVVRAMFKYTAQYPDELSFQEGDLLYVFDEVTDPNWWKARCGNQTGLIPSNYVENHGEEINFPLHEAARRGNLSFLQECLQQGVSATGLDQMGNTALYWASHGGHIDCVAQLLAQSGSMVNAQDLAVLSMKVAQIPKFKYDMHLFLGTSLVHWDKVWNWASHT